MKKASWFFGLGLCLALTLAVLNHRKTAQPEDQKRSHDSSSSIAHSSRLRQNARSHEASLSELVSGKLPPSWPQDETQRHDLLRAWAENSPNKIAAWADSLPPGEARDEAILQIALAWFAQDPQAAWDWVFSLKNGSARDATLTSLAYELCRQDPDAAFEKSSMLPEGPARTQLMEHTMAQWASSDPPSALAEAQKINDLTMRNAAFGSLVISWAESDPRAAATFAVQSMQPGPPQDRAIAAIVQRWSQQDPEGVQEWVDSFPDGPIKQNALEHIEQLAK